MLVDSGIHREMSDWMLSTIVRALLDTGCKRQALAFTSAVNLPVTTTADVELRLTVLLANGYQTLHCVCARVCAFYAFKCGSDVLQ